MSPTPATPPLTIRTTFADPTARLYRDPDDPQRVVLEVHTAERVDRQVIHAGDLTAALAPAPVSAGQVTTPEALAREAQAFLDSRDMTWEMRNFLRKVRDSYRPDAPTAPAEDREALDPKTREKAAARIWREVFQPAPGVMWSQRGAVPTEVADRCRAAVVRLHTDGLIAARQPAPVASAEQVSALADALRAEVHEHGSDGSTFEAVIRAWLGGDYDGPPAGGARPAGCCGRCPAIVGGGYDCACEGNARCAARQPAPVDAETVRKQALYAALDAIERVASWSTSDSTVLTSAANAVRALIGQEVSRG